MTEKLFNSNMTKSDQESHNSPSNLSLEPNVQAAISYLPGAGIIFFLISKDEFVRFHAMQSIVLMILGIAGGFVLGIKVILVPLIQLILFVGALYAAFKAYKNEKYELPIVGQLTYKALEALSK